MTLSEQDAILYYRLFLPLLDYVNDNYNVNDLRNIADSLSLDTREVKEVADYLWKNIEIIDKYLKDNPDLPDDHREIIHSWKKRITGHFMIERHLKKGSIFINMNNDNVYQVCGIVSSWEEMTAPFSLPCVIIATLIPFRDVIISDGLVMFYPVSFGGNAKNTARQCYLNARKNGSIIKTI